MRRSSIANRKKNPVWMWLAPSLIPLFFVGLTPFFLVLGLSFMDYSMLYPNIPRVFVGLKNFRHLTFDPWTSNTLVTTFIFAGTATGLELLIGLGLALLLSRPLKGITVWRTLMLAPMVIAPLVVGLIWMQMLNPEFGIMTYLLRRLGLFIGTAPTIETSTALLSTVVMDTWHWTPFVTLIILAGVLSLPKEPFEAAKLDGASKWQTFRHITVPLLRYPILVAFLLRFMESFKVFDEIWLLTAGGPGDATRVASIHAFKISFYRWELGYGSAICLSLEYIVVILCVIFYSLLRRK